MTKRKGKITEADFKLIRTMLDTGIKASVISTATGWSKPAIWNVKQGETWEEYKDYIHTIVAKRKAARQLQSGITFESQPFYPTPPEPEKEVDELTAEQAQDLQELLRAIDKKIDDSNTALDNALELLRDINGRKRRW